MKNLKHVQSVKKKSLRASLVFHASILALGFLPFAAQQIEEQHDEMQVIPIRFAEFASKSEGLQAKSPKVVEEIKPVNEQPKDITGSDTPEPAEEPVPVTEDVTIESDVVEETVEEVEASENNEEIETDEASAQGGFEATSTEGNAEGSAAEGEKSGSNGIDGDGVITRKIIYRDDISKVAHKDGKIVLNLCIDRFGRIREMKYNEEESTIHDTGLVREAMDVAVNYRFEKDFNAAVRECGQLTFIFDVEKVQANEILVMQ